MKIILSRKGFDSEFGGWPSPILPDGKMVSLPIPAFKKPGNFAYSELLFEGKSLYEIMKQLNSKIKVSGKRIKLTKNVKCHLDPDIYKNFLPRPKGWRPIFGQIGAAAKHLENQKVKEGDLFLFFGTFRKTKYSGGKLIFDPDSPPVHLIFGYFQIGKILKVKLETKVSKWVKYHPHCSLEKRKTKNNTIFIARKNLSWNKNLPGAATFLYFDESLVLTKNGFSKSIWKLPEFFKKVKISYHSNGNWNGDYFKARSRGQEFVIEGNKDVKDWAKNLIETNSKII